LRRTATAHALGKLAFGLSRELWIVEAGIFLNYLGWGAVMPFELIYLHEGRGLSLGAAGVVVGVVTGLAVVAAPAAGPVIDRFSAPLPTPATVAAGAPGGNGGRRGQRGARPRAVDVARRAGAA